MPLLQAPPLVERPECVERTFRTFDGAELFYRAWLPGVPTEKALILLHRGHEHSGRFEELVKSLGMRDVAVFAWDARGHGRSPGERGHADSFAVYARDLDTFVRHISNEFDVPNENMIVLGHSVGAVLAATWVHDYAPPIRAMILATPAFRVKLYIPLARAALRLRMLFGGRSFVKSYVKSSMLTHDPEQARAYDDDPLISRQIAVNILLNLHDTSTRLLDDAGTIRTPTLILASGTDWVVKNSAIRRFFARLSSPIKQLHAFDGFSHAIFHEARRELPIARVREFVRESFARSSTDQGSGLDRFTLARFEQLHQPLPLTSPTRWSLAIQRLFMRTVGRLSFGIRLGWQSGFSSGPSLDHVYQNRARGTTPLGRLIDRLYLNAIGWRCIRRRKVRLQEMVVKAMASLRAEGQPVRILDIASGPGRYLLEILRDYPRKDVSAVLRDRDPAALDQGRAVAAQLGVHSVKYIAGDAFDATSLAQIDPAPNVAIVSGLYELFVDNNLILRSLKGLAQALPRGGYLIYTNQPWHPQLDMIGRVLVHSDGSPWIMRCRPQYEMNALVRSAGFEKIDMLIDDHGIFTVSLARRI